MVLTLRLCAAYRSQNKQRHLVIQHLQIVFVYPVSECLLRLTQWVLV